MRAIAVMRPVFVERLVTELSALPALAPTPGPLGLPEARFYVTTAEGVVTLLVPDDADEAAIGAVIAAHDPTPAPPPTTQAEQLASAIADANRRTASVASLDE